MGSQPDPLWGVAWVQIWTEVFLKTEGTTSHESNEWTVLEFSSQRTCPLVDVGRLDSTG